METSSIESIIGTLWFMSLFAGAGLVSAIETKRGQLIQALFFIVLTTAIAIVINLKYADLFFNQSYAIMAVLSTLSQFTVIPIVNHFRPRQAVDMTVQNAITLICYSNSILVMLVITGQALIH